MKHRLIILFIIGITATVSAFLAHRVLLSFILSRSAQSVAKVIQQRAPFQNESPITPFPTDAYGVHILPTVDPTYPLKPGTSSVGGVTACERLSNLRACLLSKKSPLLTTIKAPESSSGAGLEQLCGSLLNEYAPQRPASVAVGCFW